MQKHIDNIKKYPMGEIDTLYIAELAVWRVTGKLPEDIRRKFNFKLKHPLLRHTMMGYTIKPTKNTYSIV